MSGTSARLTPHRPSAKPTLSIEMPVRTPTMSLGRSSRRARFQPNSAVVSISGGSQK